MKKYNKVVVCGCSISSTTGVDKAWGHYLSARLGMEYLHLASGCGSDKRGIRLLTQGIMLGEIDENSLVLFQPTEVTRRELPSSVTEEEYEEHLEQVASSTEAGAEPMLERTLTGRIVNKFKIDSHKWQWIPTESRMHIHTQQDPGSLDPLFDSEELSVYHYMLESMCKQKNITLVMVNDGDRGWIALMGKHMDLGAIYDTKLWFNIDNVWNQQERNLIYALNPPSDIVHFSSVGHIKLADDIHTFLEEKGVI